MRNFNNKVAFVMALAIACGLLTYRPALAQDAFNPAPAPLPEKAIYVCEQGSNPKGMYPCQDDLGRPTPDTPLLYWIRQNWIAELQTNLVAAQNLSNVLQAKVAAQEKQMDEQGKLLKAEAYAIADMEKRISSLEHLK